jgi:EAL domain-containing protein (putative c-di-GMP-specific phosphodiesterase class I)
VGRKNAKSTAAVLEELKDGDLLAVDDFGTGYSAWAA